MNRYAMAMLFLFFNAAALATEIPRGSSYDSRIQSVVYNDGDVVSINTVVGRGLWVVFSENETIKDVASGFTDGWKFTAKGNVLFIKARSIDSKSEQDAMPPVPGKWNTNLMVRTSHRQYDFDLNLVSSSNGRKQKISYRVVFKYPQDELLKNAKIQAKQAALSRMSAKNAPKNWEYTMSVGEGSESIVPNKCYDDGLFTYMKFPDKSAFPTVFMSTGEESEEIVDFHIDPKEPDVMAVHVVAKELRLRLGNKVVGVYNEKYQPEGLPTNNGTSVPGVKRSVISEGVSNE